MKDASDHGIASDSGGSSSVAFEPRQAATLNNTAKSAFPEKRYDISGPRLALVLSSLWLGVLFVALGEHCLTRLIDALAFCLEFMGG
jgi:hypothetical protein